MILFSRFLLAGAALAAIPGPAALAADYDPPLFIEQAPEYVPVEVGSGWYLRGDIGYTADTSARGDYTYRTYDFASGTYGSADFDTFDVDSDFTFGGGVGYHFTDWFRADATIEGFQGKFNGTTESASPCIDPAVDPAYLGTTCRSEDGTRFNAMSIMANGYVDLGTFAGFTPYLGAGAGMTYLRWKDLSSDIYCADGVGACPAPAQVASVSNGGRDDWRFTYALMAGVAYDIGNNLKVDLGYKYRRIDDGDMFDFDDASQAAGASGVQGSDGGFDQHEIRVGLRYELW